MKRHWRPSWAFSDNAPCVSFSLFPTSHCSHALVDGLPYSAVDMRVLIPLASLQHDVQCQELTRIREYESRILERDTEAQVAQLGVQTALSASLMRISALLRSALRAYNGEGEDADPDAADWALERECELARLERENAVLRTLLGAPGGEDDANLRLALPPPQEDGRRSVLSAVREGNVMKGGPKGTVGPFGAYKKLHIS